MQERITDLELDPVRPSRRAGFSLLEVLLATTVLIVIVMMVGLIFQQSNNAWKAGTRRADSETVLRGIMGFIERDLTHALDDAAFGGGIGSFTAPDYMTFLTLDGTNRVPLKVDYNFLGGNLTRKCWQMHVSGGAWSPIVGSEVTAVINGDAPLNSFVLSYTNAPAGSASTNLPLLVTVEAHMVSRGNSGLVSGWCEGRNRPGHPEDRIEAVQ
jgi:Tfp pilus assembly protein PilW